MTLYKANVPSTRDRAVDSIAVPCPSCEVPAGTQCISSTGKRTYHVGRRRMALRKEPPYQWVNVEYAREMPGWMRREVRELMGMRLAEVGKLLDISYDILRHWEVGDGPPPSGPGGAAYGEWLRYAHGKVTDELERRSRLRGHK
jgi:hypothetical protein